MLLGQYRLKLDRAGRFSLPVAIRTALHERYAPEETALIPSTYFAECIVCYPRIEWYNAQERFRRMGATPMYLRDFLTSAALCPLDEEGRLYLPHLFQQYAHIERDVMLIGVVSTLELWAPHRWVA
jgi:transcriptional regulator MraZ